MKKSLDINLIHTDQAKIQAALSEYPSSTDPDVWGEQYNVGDVHLDEETGDYVGNAMVRFNEEIPRETIYSTISVLQDMLSGFEVGSYIQKHDCNHDEGGPCTK